tara:strand:+ start:219 stop:710 length:492 start_codon:yes stop_codon:yes gene_type:complete
MPQLNPEFFISQLFWLTIFFVFLFVFLWRISLPRIATVLEKRQNLIDQNLLTAKELQVKAQEIEQNINNKINSAKIESDDTVKKIISSLENEVNSQLHSLDKDLEKKLSESEKEILINRDNQLKNIHQEIFNITKLTVSKISNFELLDQDIDKAIKTHNERLN